MFVPVGTEERPRRRRFPLANATVVATNMVVFVIELGILLTAGEAGLDRFFTDWGVVPARFAGGEAGAVPAYLTLFTSMFVHGSLTHVGFNMAYLLAFGDNIEDRLGPWRYLVFYFVSGLLASATHTVANSQSGIAAVGASGAIAGVLGAYLVLFPRGIVRMFLFFGPLSRITRLPALGFIAIWFATQFFSGVLSLGVTTAETAGIAYWAHLGGFVAGVGLAFVYRLLFAQAKAPARAETWT